LKNDNLLRYHKEIRTCDVDSAGVIGAGSDQCDGHCATVPAYSVEGTLFISRA